MSPSVTPLRILRFFIGLILALAALAAIMLIAVPVGFYGMALYLEPDLPSVKEIKTLPQQMPLQIYSHDNLLIGQWGENRLSLPVTYNEIPEHMVHALLAAEDSSFFEHSGISVKGLGRAITQLMTDDDSQTGGSTITMQVAKNYFLTPDQTFKRKLTELFLSRKIEQEMSKDEILTLYVNKIYLGEGAYGIKAAAKRYFSKSLNNLTIAEIAVLAGLPKAPSDNNPVENPEEAKIRRDWILKRMFNLGFITQDEYQTAIDEPITLNLYEDSIDHDMPHLAEMARYSLVKQFGKEVMNSGWRVRLTIDSKVQDKADAIMRKRLIRYDRQHGWRGAEAKAEDNKPLSSFNTFYNMHPVKVTKVAGHSFTAETKDGKEIKVYWSGMKWARKYYSANRVGRYPANASRIVSEGDIVRVTPYNDGKSWRLVQVPKIQGSLVSINPETGALIAVVSGFHYGHSKFNRATDGWRQPGSTIKPLIYSAALEKGYRPNSIISDSPLRIGNWRPRNSDGRYYGPMTLRRALYLSRNLVSIRLLRSVGMANARNLLDQYGLDKDKLPTTLSLALGTGQASPLQMATAYSTFANGGHRIQPYLIDQIYNFDHELIYQANPVRACAVCYNDNLEELNKQQQKKIDAYIAKNIGNDAFVDVQGLNTPIATTLSDLAELEKKIKEVDAKNSQLTEEKPEGSENGETEIKAKDEVKDEVTSTKKTTADANAKLDRMKVYPTLYSRAEQAPRILSPYVAYEMANILKDVIQRGTATRAKKLGRSDIGGKTGTTNNFRDAWFAGFHPTNATVVWMGFDTPSTLGRRQYGGRLALPVWMDWMRYQLKGVPTQWVSLNNQAKSKKEKKHTIDITEDGTVDSEDSNGNNNENKPNLPEGKSYRRKAPMPAPFTSNNSYFNNRTRAQQTAQGNQRIQRQSLGQPQYHSQYQYQQKSQAQRQREAIAKRQALAKRQAQAQRALRAQQSQKVLQQNNNRQLPNTATANTNNMSTQGTASIQWTNTNNTQNTQIKSARQVDLNVTKVNELPPMPGSNN